MRNPAPLWTGLLYDPGRLAALQYTHVQPRRGAKACKLLEASQPPPLALVITHETPDRFTACRGSFVSICLYVLTAPQSRPGRAQAVRGYTYTITGRKARREPQRGAQRPRLHHVHRIAPGGRRAVCPCPGLESMVKPRSRGGQVCRRAGSRRAGVAALLPLLRLLKLVFLPFCPFWAFCDFCKSPFCDF